MIQKFFPLDKNYLLEEAQLQLRESLLFALVERVKEQYELTNNPLGLCDSFFEKIRNYTPRDLKPLYAFYTTLAGIYRYKHGDNQLELLWGGESHYEKYKADWSLAFNKWTAELCHRGQFIQAILEVTVFDSQNKNAQLAENRMQVVMLQFLEVKIHKSRGIVAMKAAAA